MAITHDTQVERDGHYRSLVGNGDPVSYVKDIAADIDNMYWDLGAVILHLKTSNDYKRYLGIDIQGHSEWRRFVETHLNMSYRKAQYLIGIYTYFTTMGITPDRLAEIGWAKAAILVNATKDAGELEMLLAQAKTATQAELRASVKEFKQTVGQDTRPVVTFTAFNFVLPEDQGRIASDIVRRITARDGIGINEAFFKIAVEWFNSPHGYVYADAPESGELFTVELTEQPQNETQNEPAATVTFADDDVTDYAALLAQPLSAGFDL